MESPHPAEYWRRGCRRRGRHDLPGGSWLLAAIHQRTETPGSSRAQVPGSYEVARQGLHAAWLGHSTVLLKIDGYTILTDPVFSTRAGIHLGPITLGSSDWWHLRSRFALCHRSIWSCCRTRIWIISTFLPSAGWRVHAVGDRPAGPAICCASVICRGTRDRLGRRAARWTGNLQAWK